MPRTEAVDLASMMPETGILPYYVSEAKRLTRAPDVYHLASIVTVLGSVLDPVSCCYLKIGDGLFREERLFLWTCLLGPTDNKKTYSSELALDILKPWTERRIRSPEGGRRGLEDMIINQRNPVVHIREFGAWIANNRAAYAGDGATWWTQVYDGTYLARNVAGTSGPLRRFRVGATVLAMGPQREIETKSKATDWHSGLFPRLNFCWGPAIDRGPGGAKWPDEVRRRLRSGVRKMIAMARETRYLTVSRTARMSWTRWDDRHSKKLERMSELHAKMGSRLSWHVLRIATIYAASRLSPVVEREDVVRACVFGKYLRRSAEAIEPRVSY